MCVFQKGHIGETQHASSPVSLSLSLALSGWKVFRRGEDVVAPQTIYCPSVGIPHAPGMGTDSGKGRHGEPVLALLS